MILIGSSLVLSFSIQLFAGKRSESHEFYSPKVNIFMIILGIILILSGIGGMQ